MLIVNNFGNRFEDAGVETENPGLVDSQFPDISKNLKFSPGESRGTKKEKLFKGTTIEVILVQKVTIQQSISCFTNSDYTTLEKK
jgi:hypothetical protein